MSKVLPCCETVLAYVLYTVANVQPAAAGQRADPGLVLEADLQSKPGRAWKTYQERSTRLKNAQQNATGKNIFESNLVYFRNAEEVRPAAVRFHGETQGEMKRKSRSELQQEIPSYVDAVYAGGEQPG
jgi:hypothetical protein